MKKWLWAAAALAAIGLLSRLPHPAKDIASLEPVRTVYLYQDGAQLHIETDTGASGSGKNLTEAYGAMKAGASGEIFLDTAEFLILEPAVPITEDFYELFRPACRVCFTAAAPDLKEAADYLAIHKPHRTLAKLRGA